MKKATTVIILLITAFIGAMILNLDEFAFGKPANIKNMIVTVLYVAVWIFVLAVTVKRKRRKIILYCSIFWIVTLLSSLLTVFINATEVSANWALPLCLLFLSPFYGIEYFVNNYLSSSIIISVVSLGMSIAAILFIIRINTVAKEPRSVST